DGHSGRRPDVEDAQRRRAPDARPPRPQDRLEERAGARGCPRRSPAGGAGRGGRVPGAPMTKAAERILNVDDYAPARYARSPALRRAGFDVLEATTGAEALRIVADERPDLVLLDVNLPDVDGFEVCRQLRQQPGP